MGNGLFQWIRNTSFWTFFVAWIGCILLFGIIYMAIAIPFSINGLPTYGIGSRFTVSFLVATIFWMGGVSYVGAEALVYAELIVSGLLLLIMVDKLLQRFVFPNYRMIHGQDKKINTLMLLMSIFRSDIERIRVDAKSSKHIPLKRIEAAIDGLYVVFIDIEKMFSVRNLHRHKISRAQYFMLTTNIEDCLEKLMKFIEFLEGHDVVWKDKSIEFWMKYILDTADKITVNMESSDIKAPRLIISLENIKEYTESIGKKL
jgi:hypothetical protein